jgi:methyl-accepting chemotaxis protein
MVKNKRKKIVVDFKLQLSLVSSFLSIFLLASGICFIALTVLFQWVETIALASGLPEGSSFFFSLDQLEGRSSAVYGMLVLLCSLFVIYRGMLLTRSVAGPIYALNQRIERICAGEPVEQLRFRKTDYFSDLQNSFNELMRYYENGAEHRTAPDLSLGEQAEAKDKELAGVGIEA